MGFEDWDAPRQVSTVRELTAARVALANDVAHIFGVDRSGVRLPWDYAVLWAVDVGGSGVRVASDAATQAEYVSRSLGGRVFEIRPSATVVAAVGKRLGLEGL